MHKNIFYLILLFVFSFASHSEEILTNNYDSAHSVILNGALAGNIQSRSQNKTTIKRLIHSQIKYSIGQLNGLDGGTPNLNSVKLKIQSIQYNYELQLYDVSYQAKLIVAWPKYTHIPDSYKLILPKQAEKYFLQSFVNEFGNQNNCIDQYAHDITVSNFWYYYRPEKTYCPLKNLSQESSKKFVYHLPLLLRKSEENTEGRFPEYGQIWEDGQLEATLIFGQYKNLSSSDEGVQAYHVAIQSLVRNFGLPISSNLDEETQNNLIYFRDGINHPEIELIFNTPNGKLKVSLFLISGIRTPGDEFIKKYSEKTKTSDFVSYNGHSGLGANIRALANMGEFNSNQYQIFFINGCDTFSYIDDALGVAHKRVNPQYPQSKFLDLITNAMPSYFSDMGQSNTKIIKALVNQNKTYREILSEINKIQRAIVSGEEDNQWPKSFYP